MQLRLWKTTTEIKVAWPQSDLRRIIEAAAKEQSYTKLKLFPRRFIDEHKVRQWYKYRDFCSVVISSKTNLEKTILSLLILVALGGWGEKKKDS